MKTQKEQAINVIAKVLKEIDKNAILLNALPKTDNLTIGRLALFDALSVNGYELDINYKPIIKK